MNETETVKAERWHDTRHQPLDEYWGQLIQSWDDYYAQTHKDFIREFFIKLVGIDYLRFAKNYNHRMKADIDAVPGLSDFIFDDFGLRKQYSSVFLMDSGFKFTPASFEFSSYNDTQLRYRNETVQNYFNTRYPTKINNLTDCGHFAFKRRFRFSIVDCNSSEYYRGNNEVVDGLLLDPKNSDHSLYRLLNQPTLGFYRRPYEDGTGAVVEVIVLSIGEFTMKYMYDSTQTHINLPGMSVKMAAWDDFYGSGYNDLYTFNDSHHRTLFIKCNTPLFDAESVKMFHFFEKLTHFDNKFVSDYVKHMADVDKPETMFYDQLILRFFLENPTLRRVHEFLNTTRPRSYRYDATSDTNVPGVYLNWLMPSARTDSREYDRYSRASTYNLDIIERFPPYYDLLNKCLFDAYADTFNEGWRMNEDPEQHAQRLRGIQSRKVLMNELLGNANLIRDKYFLSLKGEFEKGK